MRAVSEEEYRTDTAFSAEGTAVRAIRCEMEAGRRVSPRQERFEERRQQPGVFSKKGGSSFPRKGMGRALW